jgi:hypothetical protein
MCWTRAWSSRPARQTRTHSVARVSYRLRLAAQAPSAGRDGDGRRGENDRDDGADDRCDASPRTSPKHRSRTRVEGARHARPFLLGGTHEPAGARRRSDGSRGPRGDDDERPVQRSRRSVQPSRSCQLAATSRDGSDGTRTRDLRRDRPSQARRRSTTNLPERLHLQVLLAAASPQLGTC